MYCRNDECQLKWVQLYETGKFNTEYNKWLPNSKTPKEVQQLIDTFRNLIAHQVGYVDRDVNAAMNIGHCGWMEVEMKPRPVRFTKENKEEKKTSHVSLEL